MNTMTEPKCCKECFIPSRDAFIGGAMQAVPESCGDEECSCHLKSVFKTPDEKKELNIGKNNWYCSKVDFKLLFDNDIRVFFYQPWQIGLFREELEGKFIWYPKYGTLMFHDADSKYPKQKIGDSGSFIAGGHDAEQARPTVTQDVIDAILRTVAQQKNKNKEDAKH